MSAALALLAAGAVWSHPGAAPCAGPRGNPCWDAAHVPAAALAAERAGAGAPGAICDGDVIANHGARAGRAFGPVHQVAAFDRAWLAASGARWGVAADGRACIPSLVYAGIHKAEICGNPIFVVEAGAPPAALALARGVQGGVWGGVWGGRAAGYAAHGAPPEAPGGPGGAAFVPPLRPDYGAAPVAPVPLPWSAGLLGGALAMLAAMRFRRRA